jgi:hypothetical protein
VCKKKDLKESGCEGMNWLKASFSGGFYKGFVKISECWVPPSSRC